MTQTPYEGPFAPTGTNPMIPGDDDSFFADAGSAPRIADLAPVAAQGPADPLLSPSRGMNPPPRPPSNLAPMWLRIEYGDGREQGRESSASELKGVPPSVIVTTLRSIADAIEADPPTLPQPITLEAFPPPDLATELTRPVARVGPLAPFADTIPAEDGSPVSVPSVIESPPDYAESPPDTDDDGTTVPDLPGVDEPRGRRRAR